MTTKTEGIVRIGNLNVHLIPSKKYKTVTMELFFRGILDRETITGRVLLPHVMRKGTADFPDETKIREKLDDLYGASFQIGSWKNGPYHMMNFHIDCPNEMFVPGGAGLAEDTLRFLSGAVFRPLAGGDGFDEEIVSREKEAVRGQIRAMLDDKMSYANQRLTDIMCEGEPCAVRGQGYEEDLPEIDGQTLYDTYRRMLKEDRRDLFIVGDFEPDAMEETVRDVFGDGEAEITPDSQLELTAKKEIGEERLIVEREDVQQAKLHIGYRTGTVYQDDDFPAMMVYAMILGGYAGSKLFANVREKHSLAYYVSAAPELFGDKLFVYSGIAPEDFQQTADIVDEQFRAMEAGDFTDEELELAKTIIISNHRQSLDSAVGMIDLRYRQVLGGDGRTPEEMVEEIGRTGRDAVIRAARKVRKDTTFLLTAKEGSAE